MGRYDFMVDQKSVFSNILKIDDKQATIDEIRRRQEKEMVYAWRGRELIRIDSDRDSLSVSDIKDKLRYHLSPSGLCKTAVEREQLDEKKRQVNVIKAVMKASNENL